MVLLTYCIPCRGGNHDRCHGVMQAVPKGMMGGARCRCEGECRTSRAEPLETQEAAEAYFETAECRERFEHVKQMIRDQESEAR